MKNIILKTKVLFTNISRVIMNLLFVNLKFSFTNKVFAVSTKAKQVAAVTCYDTVAIQPNGTVETTIGNGVGNTVQSAVETVSLENILIILVPVAIIIGLIMIFIKKRKSKKAKKEEKKDE